MSFKFFIISIVLIFKPAFQSYCGSYLPQSETSCDQFTNTTSICCYLSGTYIGTPFKMCYPFQREFYYTMKRTVEINGYLMKLDCGSKRGASCGTIVTPSSYKDCSIYSSKKNSCCYYQYKGDTGCVWLGSSSIGIMKYKGLSLICSEYYIKYTWLFLLLAILLF